MMSGLSISNLRSAGAVDETAYPRRIVRVFVTDPDRDAPLEICVLYQSAEKLTDQTDSELFLELGIPRLLTEHNENRAAHSLKAIKARDLRMAVATLVYI